CRTSVPCVPQERSEHYEGSVQNLSHFRLAERHPALAHAVMASLICWSFSNSMFRYLGRPRAGDVAQPCGGEVERGLTVRERAHHARAPSDLVQDALERVVGANPPPVLLREGVVGECLLDCRFHQLGSAAQAQATQLLDHSVGLLACCREVL